MGNRRGQRPARRKRNSKKRMLGLSQARYRKLSRQQSNTVKRRFHQAPPSAQPDQRLPEHVQNTETAGTGDQLQDQLSTENGAVAAVNAKYEEGYRQGYYEGGEGRLCRQLPPYTVLPDLTIEDVIARGIQQAASLLVPLMTPTEVYAEIGRALDQRQPFSVVRLGDGELLTLAHDMIISTEQARAWGSFLPYAGVILPDEAARSALADSLHKASIIGIPESRHPSFQGLLFPVLKQLGISCRELKMTTSTVNYALHEQGLLYPMLRGRKLLLIGNKAGGLANVLSNHGFKVNGIITPVNGVHDVRRVMKEATSFEFELALVAAGVAAVVICATIAEELGKVSFDLGHLANQFEPGETSLLPGLEVNK
ncbi:GT-D fold domain-containing glycosyltransferase [Paenibacillus lentus]|uniref:GT-D fold domain-containing protein n=1 Tax=Paenibacillus lentus TaxID=1338368 RepID=UPI001B8625EC|nr:GT-D fold domain-containing glycosyltransferase [Paenibacillus lentus]